MKKVTMFIMASCPYCRQAQAWMDEAVREHPEFGQVEVEMIDENLRPDVANAHDYYYVPTFYLEGKKVHEGAATKAIVEGVYRAALE